MSISTKGAGEAEVRLLDAIAGHGLLEELSRAPAAEPIEGDLADEVYALVHFGPSTIHQAPSARRLETEVESRRYFQETLVCYECRKSGHVARECKERPPLVCALCGEMGHRKSRCHRRVCGVCELTGHNERDCFQRRPWRKCMPCIYPDHCASACPAYRMRALSSSPGGAPSKAQLLRKSCACCCGETHFLGECKQRDPLSNTTFYRDFRTYRGYPRGTSAKHKDKDLPAKGRPKKRRAARHSDKAMDRAGL